MFEFLPLPPWDAMHPLVVHFPVALLLVTPLLVIAGAFMRGERGRGWLHAALMMMFLGTLGTWVAVRTGEAGEEAAERVQGTKALLHEHEELAEFSRNAFTGLTVVFAAIVCLPRLTRKPDNRFLTTVLPLVFLLAYAVGMAALANAAHHGGMLVHERGVIADWAGTGAGAGAAGGEVEDEE